MESEVTKRKLIWRSVSDKLTVERNQREKVGGFKGGNAQILA